MGFTASASPTGVLWIVGDFRVYLIICFISFANSKNNNLVLHYIKNHPRISFTTARIYPRKIEEINIANCANLAALRCYNKIAGFINETSAKEADYSDSAVFLDGSLYLGGKKSQPSFAKTVIRGDEKFVVIKLASIIAKVTRDRYMTRLHEKQPLYRFNLHKGYGTALHRALIRKHGPAETHRLTYLKNYRKLAAV